MSKQSTRYFIRVKSWKIISQSDKFFKPSPIPHQRLKFQILPKPGFGHTHIHLEGYIMFPYCLFLYPVRCRSFAMARGLHLPPVQAVSASLPATFPRRETTSGWQGGPQRSKVIRIRPFSLLLLQKLQPVFSKCASKELVSVYLIYWLRSPSVYLIYWLRSSSSQTKPLPGSTCQASDWLPTCITLQCS